MCVFESSLASFFSFLHNGNKKKNKRGKNLFSSLFFWVLCFVFWLCLPLFPSNYTKKAQSYEKEKDRFDKPRSPSPKKSFASPLALSSAIFFPVPGRDKYGEGEERKRRRGRESWQFGAWGWGGRNEKKKKKKERFFHTLTGFPKLKNILSFPASSTVKMQC